MHIILNILAFLFAIFLLVMTHECGHFFVARLFKVKILKFSIGFGKAIFRWKGKNGMEYVLAWLPLGGYVKMLDTREMTVAKKDLHLALDKKPFLQKMLIVLAGPLTNIIIGLLAFWLMFAIGIKAPKPIIGAIQPNSIASSSELKAGDIIVAVDGNQAANWQEVMLPLFSHLGNYDKVNLTIYRAKDGSQKDYVLDLSHWQLNTTTFDLLNGLGIDAYQPEAPTIIGSIQKDTPAANSDLKANDKIISIDDHVVNNWNDLVSYLHDNPNKLLHIKVLRDKKLHEIDVVSDWRFGSNWKKIGFLGITPVNIDWPEGTLQEEHYSAFGALQASYIQTYKFIEFNGIALKKLITRKIPMSVLGGPISVFQSSSAALNHGLVVYVGFLAIFSVMLAFVNLIPIPGLDGGHILIFLLEGIFRRPIPIAVQILLFRLGLIFLILLAVQATFNDLTRIFTS